MQKFKNFIIVNYLPTILFFFSIFICHYTGSRGVFPIDSFSHFDNGYRILHGDHPFKDYWVVSGPFLDYLQSLIYLVFGANWQTYLLSASLLNGLLALITYHLFINLNLSPKISFFYAICFSILAYPSSGTIFVDHHSVFMSILALYSLIWALLKDKNYYWFLIPLIMALAFLSKQVPAGYIFFIILGVLIYHLFFLKKKNIIRIISLSAFSCIVSFACFFFFLKVNSIELKSFITQYLSYPGTIGAKRFESVNYNFKNIFLDFKFIYFALFILIYLILKSLLKEKFYYKKINFKIFLIFFFLFFFLIQHIVLTKNQIFIFFLIPLLSGLAHAELIKQENKKIKLYFKYLLIILCVGTSLKYHYRFNVERKFHELNGVNFSHSINASKLDKKLSGLKWITPGTASKRMTQNEIKYLINVKSFLKKDKNQKILITNYSIFTVILDENVSSYTRWFPGDDSAYPLQSSKYFDEYKNLILKIIINKKIKNVYILKDVKETYFTDFVDQKCFSRKKVEFEIIKFEKNDVNCL